MFWRPITAIQRADTDDNPATERDKDWLPLIATPPYPDHPSGLSAFGASNVATAQELFRTDDVEFGTTNTIGIPQTYQRLSDAIEQIVDARVWSGIHFRAADVQGARIGRDVARWRRDQAFFARCITADPPGHRPLRYAGRPGRPGYFFPAFSGSRPTCRPTRPRRRASAPRT